MTTPNGCGGAGSVIDPPELRFHAACNEHDLAYGRGGSSRDRRKADNAFLGAMLRKAGKAPWYKAAYLLPSAVLYWGAVRIWGGEYWGR